MLLISLRSPAASRLSRLRRAHRPASGYTIPSPSHAPKLYPVITYDATLIRNRSSDTLTGGLPSVRPMGGQ